MNNIITEPPIENNDDCVCVCVAFRSVGVSETEWGYVYCVGMVERILCYCKLTFSSSHYVEWTAGRSKTGPISENVENV